MTRAPLASALAAAGILGTGFQRLSSGTGAETREARRPVRASRAPRDGAAGARGPPRARGALRASVASEAELHLPLSN